jgi:predicted  nucleic acid-binding Zn ribbon protein
MVNNSHNVNEMNNYLSRRINEHKKRLVHIKDYRLVGASYNQHKSTNCGTFRSIGCNR